MDFGGNGIGDLIWNRKFCGNFVEFRFDNGIFCGDENIVDFSCITGNSETNYILKSQTLVKNIEASLQYINAAQ